MKNNNYRGIEKWISIPQPLWDFIMETIENMDETFCDPIMTRANVDVLKINLKKYGFDKL